MSSQSAGCSFTLGFATLHDPITDVVGTCLDNEFHDPQTGDALQHTTNGLLAGANPTTGQPSPTGFSRGDPLPTTVVRGGGYFTNDPPPTLVDVPAHGAAIFRLHWEQVPVGNETTCPMASRLAVTPPDEYVALTIPIQIRACGGGHLDVSAVFSL